MTRFVNSRSSFFALACLLPLTACSNKPEATTADGGTSATDGGPDWHIVFDELPGALFSVTGTSEDNVWAVGADQLDGNGPTVRHWDGEEWTAPDTGRSSGDLLWVHAVDDEVFMAGSEGMILQVNGTAFDVFSTPSNQTVWGVWGASASELWAVGGEASGGNGFVWRYDGSEWTALTLDAALPAPSAWYKVWGSAADDVWFCGTEGALMHWDGSEFTAVDAATDRTLLTVHGRADGSLVTAVGGQFTATLVASRDGEAFSDVTPEEGAEQAFGVYHRGDTAYAVGLNSTVLRQEDDGPWQAEATDLLIYQSLHSVWIDPEGGVWAAGGQIVVTPYTEGMLIYKGSAPLPDLEDE
jgi:hypothetical protein